MPGKLFLVATPIGNLEDITFRAVQNLKESDIVACEDTRRTKILLNKYEIHKELISHHSYSTNSKTNYIIDKLLDGNKVAYVTDGGTPGISDPGEILVREALKNNIPVECLPGPSACITALAASGLPTNGFVFIGFLPRKPGKIKKTLLAAAALEKTVIFYESPFRIKKTLEICCQIFEPQSLCVVARELTKIYEEYIRGTLSEVSGNIAERKEIKGEIVTLIHTASSDKREESEETEEEHL
ncbi:MAG: 16S rRNA (cytidine(1402)-2'-O)-methyltransferase [Elusimicrobia bacterium RIFOXYA2_FULL_39_19]|nr:MAG: 16S rRNA (cytidine(1402)-2'-O)-methyltransferase [Elusimicrobia bacterium RIFOXYA2_FULL_39_19]